MRVLAPLSDALWLKRDSENKVCSTIQMVLSIYISTKDRSVLFVMRISSCGCTLKGRRAGGKVRSYSKCNKEQVQFLLRGNIDAFFIKTGFVCDHLYQCSLPVLFFFFGLLAKKSIPSGKNNPSSLSLAFIDYRNVQPKEVAAKLDWNFNSPCNRNCNSLRHVSYVRPRTCRYGNDGLK